MINMEEWVERWQQFYDFLATLNLKIKDWKIIIKSKMK